MSARYSSSGSAAPINARPGSARGAVRFAEPQHASQPYAGQTYAEGDVSLGQRGDSQSHALQYTQADDLGEWIGGGMGGDDVFGHESDSLGVLAVRRLLPRGPMPLAARRPPPAKSAVIAAQREARLKARSMSPQPTSSSRPGSARARVGASKAPPEADEAQVGDVPIFAEVAGQ